MPAQTRALGALYKSARQRLGVLSLSNPDIAIIMSSQSNRPLGIHLTPSGTSFGAPSGAIFNMYTNLSQKLDQENVEHWKEGADTILVFVRFHAAQRQRHSYAYKPPLPDRSVLFYGGHFYRYQLPELAARSQHHHPVPPRTDIRTTFQNRFQRPHSPHDFIHPKPLLPLRFGGIHQLSLVPQPRAQPHMRPYGHTLTTMGPQIPPDGSTKPPTSCPCPYSRILLSRRMQVRHLRAR